MMQKKSLSPGAYNFVAEKEKSRIAKKQIMCVICETNKNNSRINRIHT